MSPTSYQLLYSAMFSEYKSTALYNIAQGGEESFYLFTMTLILTACSSLLPNQMVHKLLSRFLALQLFEFFSENIFLLALLSLLYSIGFTILHMLAILRKFFLLTAK